MEQLMMRLVSSLIVGVFYLGLVGTVAWVLGIELNAITGYFWSTVLAFCVLPKTE